MLEGEVDIIHFSVLQIGGWKGLITKIYLRTH